VLVQLPGQRLGQELGLLPRQLPPSAAPERRQGERELDQAADLVDGQRSRAALDYRELGAGARSTPGAAPQLVTRTAEL
jgi:hypothetical protein